MDADEYPIDITTDEFKRDFYDKVSKMDVALFYLRHPIRFAKKVAFSIENASCLKPLNCGNSETVSMYYSNRYSIWSDLRVATKILYNPYIVPIIALIMTAYAVLIHMYLVRNKRQTNEKRIYLISALYVLMAGLWINMCLPVIGNGEADIMKHMFLFANCMDILFASIIIGIVNMQKRNRIVTISVLVVTVLLLQIEPPKKTVEFGSYNGKKIKWEIMNEYDDGTVEMVTKKCIDKLPFDYENNMWETSYIRNWLNSDFIKEFTLEELSALQSNRNEVMLTYNDRGLAVSGDHTHYWSATVGEVNDLSETAYKYYVDDIVYIPTLEMMKEIDVNGSYWILCPYGGNDRMQRYMTNDGFVLHTNVDNVQGVRAAVRVKLGD